MHPWFRVDSGRRGTFLRLAIERSSSATRTLFADRSWEATVSYLLSPPLVMSALAVPVALRDAQAGDRPLLWAALYAVLSCLIPGVYVGVHVLRGSVGDLLLRERRERHRPYLVTLLGMSLSWVALDWLGTTAVMRAVVLAGLVNVAVMAVVTVHWKISLHTMTIGFVLACLALLFSPMIGLVFAPLLPLAVIVRYRLRSHTLGELLAGAVLGAMAPLVIFGMYPV